MIEYLKDTLVYAGRVKNTDVLLSSSSGGAYTTVSDYFLNNNNAVIAVIYNYDNHTAEFQIILDKECRDKSKGSKYMQSKPGDIYREAYRWLMENADRELLFVGMGCQADGFRKFSELKGIRNRVYIVDIVCHGSPSPKLWREYAHLIETDEKISYLTFKDKRNGWKSPTAYVKISGKEKLIKEYVKIFYNRCALRPSCYECPYATVKRNTDMTIGDFWHIEDTIPDFYNANGNSLFLIHSSRGLELFNKIKKDLDYRLSDTIQCWQANLEAPTSKSAQRNEFWRDYQLKGIGFVVKKYGRASIMTRIKNRFLVMCGGYKVSSFLYTKTSIWRAA